MREGGEAEGRLLLLLLLWSKAIRRVPEVAWKI
jgi:hypothetical protein